MDENTLHDESQRPAVEGRVDRRVMDHAATLDPALDGQRAEFEAWVKSLPWPEDAPLPRKHVLNRFPSGYYVTAEYWWKAWLAARGIK